MGKINTTQIHKSDDASIWYGGIIVNVIREIRRTIVSLKKTKKADQSAMGSIHALRKLLEDEESYFGLARGEVDEWILIIEEWYKKASRYIPKDMREGFKKNLDEDLAIILSKSTKTPDYMWRKQSLERQITITVESEEIKEKYYQQTEAKHPVALGNSLNKYLLKCLNNLDENIQGVSVETPKKNNTSDILNIRILKNKADYTLITDKFDFYNTDENKEQGIPLNAYDIEEVVKSCLDKNDRLNLSMFKFDCESSLFSVTCEKIEYLNHITEILFSLKIEEIIK